MSTSTILPPEGFARLKTVRAVLGVGRTTITRWVAEGRIPAPVKIGSRAIAWEVNALRAAMAKMAGGDA